MDVVPTFTVGTTEIDLTVVVRRDYGDFLGL
jgi:hypothetical protein